METTEKSETTSDSDLVFLTSKVSPEVKELVAQFGKMTKRTTSAATFHLLASVPAAGEREYYRLDFQNNRISIVSEASLYHGFADLGYGFSLFQTRVRVTTEEVIVKELDCGAIVFGADWNGKTLAAYSKNLEKLQRLLN